MPRHLDDWGLPCAVADLLRVAHDDHGLRNAALLSRQVGLLRHPWVSLRVDDGLDLGRVVGRALEYLAVFGGTGSGQAMWTTSENDAVKALLFATDSVPVGGLERRLRPTARDRASIASDLLGVTSEREFRRKRIRGGAGAARAWSHESELLARFVGALDALDVAPSHTRAVVRSRPLVGSAEPEVGFEDLVGTWRGTTESAWLLKDDVGGTSGSAPCFMVVEGGAGTPRLRWLYRSGVSVAVAVRLTRTTTGRRLVCVYEADLAGVGDSRFPSHRGACLLDVEGRGSGSADGPAVVVSGPYWSDRQTLGTLSFTHRIDAVTGSFADADAMFTP